MTDPFAGRISFFKVFSGVLKNDGTAQNYSRRTAEKFSHLSIMQGRNAVAVPELHAGDLGAVAKLQGNPHRRHARRQERTRSSSSRSPCPSLP